MPVHGAVVRVGAQDAQARARHGGEAQLLALLAVGARLPTGCLGALAALGGLAALRSGAAAGLAALRLFPGAQLVLAVPEEGEVVVGQPAQQLAGLLDLLLRQIVGGLVRQVVGDAERRALHLLPVLDGLPYVRECPQKIGIDLLEVVAVGLAVDLDVNPGLDERVVRQLLTPVRRPRLRRGVVPPGGEHLQQLPRQVPAHHHLRVDHRVDAAALPGQLVGHRIDQERHVVRDDLDDGVGVRPAVLVDRGGVHPDVRRTLRPVLRESVVGESGPENVDRIAVGQVLRRRVQVVPLEIRTKGVVLKPSYRVMSPGRAMVSHPRGLCQPLGFCFIQLGLHVLWLLSRAVA